MTDIFGFPVTADPDLEDGTILFGDPQWWRPEDSGQLAWPGSPPLMSLTELRELAESDPEVMEDIRSLNESSPYVVRLGEASGRMDCRRCGTPVVAVPEAPGAVAPDSRRWRRAIWEPETVRKHTLRRCEAMRVGSRL